MTLRPCSAGCGKTEEEEFQFQNCAGCKTTCYCSRACQKTHWSSGHKRECKQLKADRERKVGSTELEALAKQMTDIRNNAGNCQKQLFEIEEKLKRNSIGHQQRSVVLKQISALPAETPTYLTVGKMYLRAAKSEAHAHVQKEENITQAQDVTLTKKKRYLEEKLDSYKKQLGEITLLLRRAGMVPKLRSG